MCKHKNVSPISWYGICDAALSSSKLFLLVQHGIFSFMILLLWHIALWISAGPWNYPIMYDAGNSWKKCRISTPDGKGNREDYILSAGWCVSLCVKVSYRHCCCCCCPWKVLWNLSSFMNPNTSLTCPAFITLLDDTKVPWSVFCSVGNYFYKAAGTTGWCWLHHYNSTSDTTLRLDRWFAVETFILSFLTCVLVTPAEVLLRDSGWLKSKKGIYDYS